MRRLIIAMLLFMCTAAYGNTYPHTGFSSINNKLDYLYGQHEKYELFFTQLQEYVKTNNREKVAKMISYPIAVAGVGGKEIVLHGEKDFLKNYNIVITSLFKEKLLNQDYNELDADTYAISAANGVSGAYLAFSDICNDDGCQVKVVGLVN